MSGIDGKPPDKTKAAGPGGSTAAGLQTKQNNIKLTTCERRRNRWRDRLPDSAQYYRQALDGLRESTDNWYTARCPFHADKHASLSVNVQHGGWRCHANHGCGSGDLLAFHMRVTGLDFKAAVADLTGVRL